MVMQHVGYSLVQLSNGAAVNSWTELPNYFTVAGLGVHCAVVGWEAAGYRLVEKWDDPTIVENADNSVNMVTSFDGTKLSVVRTLVPKTPDQIAAWALAHTPQIISDRQFYQQLAVQGVITQNEALGAVCTGTLPASLVALVNQLPADQQFGAKMMLSGATQFDRNHPMVATLGVAFGWTADQLNALWTAANAV